MGVVKERKSYEWYRNCDDVCRFGNVKLSKAKLSQVEEWFCNVMTGKGAAQYCGV